MATSDPGRGLVRRLGVTAAALLAFAAASQQRAEALSLASPGTAPSAKFATGDVTTEVRHGGHGGGGGGFRGGGGGGFRGGGGGFHGGGFHGGGFHRGFGGAALGLGLGLGLAGAYAAYPYGGYYGYPYAYGDYYGDGGCYLVRRRIWTPYGWRIRHMQVCD